MRITRSMRWTGVALVGALVLSACASGEEAAPEDNEDTTAEEPTDGADDAEDTGGDDGGEGSVASGEPFTIGWLTDASSVSRGTYFPEYEGASLYFQSLNDAGGVHDRPVEVQVEDINIDQELAVTLSTQLAEDPGVIALAGGTLEGRQPGIFEVARANDIVFLSGHSARPDMFPPEPDPLLFTTGNVFEAMSDARVELWPLMWQDRFPEGGTTACYIHEAPAANAVCDRWLEFLESETEWSAGPHINAPLQTSDFSSYVQPVIDANPETFFDISIASHAIGVAVAARNGGYTGPIVFSMTATPETDIQAVVDQVGPDEIYAVSNITSIYEDDVPEIQAILDAAEQYGTEIQPNSATVNGWLMGMVIHDALERCGEDCDRSGFRDALEQTDIDTRGLTGGPLAYGPEDHVGVRYWTAYRWNPESGGLERMLDEWISFDASEDLLAPLGE